jgi:hypothetical protein
VVLELSPFDDKVSGARLNVEENPPKFQKAVVWEPDEVEMWLL